MNSGLIGSDVYNATMAASLVTILANATLFKLMKPLPTVPVARQETEPAPVSLLQGAL
jgi:hypothetical protein